MARKKSGKHVTVSSTPLVGEVLGVATASRRFRVSDVGGTTSSNADDIIQELRETAEKMGGSAISGIHFSLVGGNTRGESPRAIGHLLGWGTVLKVTRAGEARAQLGVERAGAATPLTDAEERSLDEPVVTPPAELAEPVMPVEDPSLEPPQEPEMQPVPDMATVPAMTIPSPDDMVMSEPSPEEENVQDEAFSFGGGEESLNGIAQAVAAAVEKEESAKEESVPKRWKVRTPEGKTYKAAPEEKLMDLLRAGRLSKEIQVCEEGSSEWRDLPSVARFSHLA